ncbi:MAG TPA: NADH-quinone oxidoreductase subunit H [Candidatus Binatia bacterium]|nr:NADH-quinone oxidoreductase subunit H [Candidatus Binatia bacterium]
MIVDIGIVAIKAFLVLFMVLNLAGVLGWVERKGSALIQDRIGANRASIFGFAGMGLINTLVADPLKFLTKEDFIPPAGDRFLHTLAPCLALFPALVTFAVIPFGDVLQIGERIINLQVADLNVGILYIFAMTSLGVYGLVIGAWASNNKFSLLGGVRGSAQMISYEVALGLSVIGVLMVYGTLDLQEIARGQGTLIRDLLPDSWAFLKVAVGWLPAWGIFLQPLAFLLFFTAAIAETRRIPFDLPEAESELVAGSHVEYSGGKFLMFFAAEFAEIVTVAALVTTLFFGGWQVPYLMRDGFHFPWGGTLLLPHLAVVLLQVGAFTFKVILFCWLQILLRWSVPRFRYDQVMRLGWKMLLPAALVNVMITAFVILYIDSIP